MKHIVVFTSLVCQRKKRKGKEGWIKKPDSCRHILKEIEKKLPPLPVIRAGRTKWAAACGWMWNVNRSWSQFLKLFTKPAAHHISLHRKIGNSPCLAPNRQLEILSRIIETFDSKQSPGGFKISLDWVPISTKINMKSGIKVSVTPFHPNTIQYFPNMEKDKLWYKCQLILGNNHLKNLNVVYDKYQRWQSLTIEYYLNTFSNKKYF